MQYSQQIIVKRWIPILKEYERTKAKVYKSAWMAGEFIGTPAQYPRIIASNFKKILNFANYFFIISLF